MAASLVELCFAAHDPRGLADFWAEVLGMTDLTDDGANVSVVLTGRGAGFWLRFAPSDEPKVVPNRIHFDLTSTSLQDQREIVARALDLGGRHIDIGQLPEEEHVVLADPEGNEFCVTEPGNSFLEDTAVIGALSCDGTPRVGYFWSEALGWPLVWDRGEETAIQSPLGGSKISWGGPPVREKIGRNRVQLRLVPDGDDQLAEVERLVGLGARRLDVDEVESGRIELADPDDNEFGLLPPR
jgi:hypothetical protein